MLIEYFQVCTRWYIDNTDDYVFVFAKCSFINFYRLIHVYHPYFSDHYAFDKIYLVSRR